MTAVATALAPASGLPASRGLQWWSSAITWLFSGGGQLGVWVLMALAFIVLSLLMRFIPLFGFLLSLPVHFAFSGGLMLAASRSAQAVTPPFGDLFTGFGPRAGPLLAAGALVFAACMAVFGVMLAVGVWAALAAIAGGVLDSGAWPEPSALRVGAGSAILLLLCLLALVPISMAAWLAPALVMLRGIAPVEALRLSLAACRRNLGALTVYGLVGICFAFIATLLLGLGWLVVLPMAYLSTYAAFEDLFATEVAVLP